jgi:hypothetical protein
VPFIKELQVIKNRIVQKYNTIYKTNYICIFKCINKILKCKQCNGVLKTKTARIKLSACQFGLNLIQKYLVIAVLNNYWPFIFYIFKFSKFKILIFLCIDGEMMYPAIYLYIYVLLFSSYLKLLDNVP